jgi:catechol 2,3-dioxygenase-like lactoylglutathione lyase family enzyme
MARRTKQRRSTPRAVRAVSSTTRKTSASTPPRTSARTGKAGAPPVRERRRTEPETLRLRGIEPSLTVNDLERSLRFYADVLGFYVGERWTDAGVLRGASLKAGVCQLGLSQDDWSKGRDRTKGEGMSLWLKTAQSLDKLAARIKSAGGVADGPKKESWGGRTLGVSDPDGFRLRFYEEKE